MLRQKISRFFFILFILSLSATMAFALEAPAKIEKDATWKGEVTLKGVVTVSRDATLTIAPGTVVRPLSTGARIIVLGLLHVNGTSQTPVTFSPLQGWGGIEFVEAKKGSTIKNALFEKAKVAVASLATPFTLSGSRFTGCGTAVKLIREAFPLIEKNTFVDNEIAIDNEMKSGPTIRGNTFRGQKKSAILASHSSVGPIEGNVFEKNAQGIGLIQKYTDRIEGNRFIDNEVAIYCNQTQSTPLVKGNDFSGNKKGLVNFSFSYPVVEENRFKRNGAAIFNDQFGSPLVTHNLFRENETALHNNRKANPKVEKNLFEKNGLAMFCDYSSYPQVRENNFEGNAMGVKLGIFQSADWEKKAGSKKIVQEEAASRRSQNPLIARAPTEFKDFVDVSNNWWGKDTPLLAAAGAEGNVDIFYDRKDKPKITYEGYGQESYVLDRVHFSPWLKAAVKDAGPAKKR